MADPVLKFPGDQAAPANDTAKAKTGRFSKRRRLLLLVVLPLIVGTAGLAFYLAGGRYMTTDNAYVGAQKVLITPDISGKIAKVVVREGQRVQIGDPLFEIDPEPFRLALQQAQARLANVQTDHANLISNDRALSRLIELAQKTTDLKRQDVERKTTLMANRTGSQFDLDSSNTQLVTAQTQV
ncbi:MAG: biotin/lipoyl-binding protein, partial [Rhizobiaceae bacterium]